MAWMPACNQRKCLQSTFGMLLWFRVQLDFMHALGLSRCFAAMTLHFYKAAHLTTRNLHFTKKM